MREERTERETVYAVSDRMRVEVSPSNVSDGAWEVHIATTYGHANWTGFVLPVPIRVRAKAERIARFLAHELAREQDAELQRHNAQVAGFLARDSERAEQRRIEREEQLSKITAETPRSSVFVCPHCHSAADRDDYDEPAWECSCGATHRGESRNCEVCNKFSAKIADISCPSCEEALEEEPGEVVGVVLASGEFIEEKDVPEAARRKE